MEPVIEKSRFNDSPEWAAVVASYEPVLQRIAQKVAASADDDTREDVMAEMRIALFEQWPEKIRAYRPELHGPIVPGAIPGAVDRYLRNVARNAALSFRQMKRTRDWYQGQTEWRNGVRQYQPARFTRLDELVAVGMDIDSHGNVTWNEVSTDGLVIEDDHAA